MSIFSQAATIIQNAQQIVPPAPAASTAQSAVDLAILREDKDAAGAVARLADYYGQRLDQIPADIATFDRDFPLVKRSDLVPGLERSFWRNRSAYMRWRRSARRGIAHATGAIAAKASLRAREDGWSDLLELLKALTLDGGPVHSGEYGAVVSMADRARAQDVEPKDLTREVMESLLDAAPSTKVRRSTIRALQVLEKYHYIRALAAHIPAGFNVNAARRKFENILPLHVEQAIEVLVVAASRDEDSWDETTQSYTETKADATVGHYRSAMRSYAWSTERAGGRDLDTVTDLGVLFEPQLFHSVIRLWTSESKIPEGVSASTAYNYCRNIAAILARNGIEADHIRRTYKANLFLQKGAEAAKVMSPKTRRFCEPIVRDRRSRRQFLTQHLEYRRRADDMLATDRVITGDLLTRIREMGTCAAIAAIEITGAPYRIANTLSLTHRGPTPNLLLPGPNAPHYLVTIATGIIKNRREMPAVKVRTNALQGRQTLDWYLKEIRPLFPFGNARWCASEEDEIDERIRFGLKKHGKAQTESLYFFPAVKSATHLSKGLFHEWLVGASEQIGLPMTPHMYRHGQASILMSRSLANTAKAARLLNISETTVLRHYAWINAEAVLEASQDEILAELE